ncbi:MAG TPA: MliC family protein [Stenomitos sp.]
MTRNGLAISGLLLSLFFVAYPVQGRSPGSVMPAQTSVIAAQPSSDSAQQTALKQAIARYIQQANAPETEEHRVFADLIDLNDDGRKDAIVVFNSSYWCGTGGCTMLVFAGEPDQSFRLVSKTTLVRPPITVAKTQTNGWRDLSIVVSGGGVPAKTVVMKFDGQKYPSNPSALPGLPANTTVAGTVLFPEGSEPETVSLLELATPSSTNKADQQPSFDCTQAEQEVESLICKDGELAGLDRKLDEVYHTALKQAKQYPPQDFSNFKTEQIDWIKGRNDCTKAEGNAIAECVKSSYVDRIAQLQATFGLVASQKPVFFACENNPANEIVATFYQTEPSTVRLERGDSMAIAYLRPAASGARYEGPDVMFWTKGNEAMVEWKGEALSCQAK